MTNKNYTGSWSRTEWEDWIQFHPPLCVRRPMESRPPSSLHQRNKQIYHVLLVNTVLCAKLHPPGESKNTNQLHILAKRKRVWRVSNKHTWPHLRGGQLGSDWTSRRQDHDVIDCSSLCCYRECVCVCFDVSVWEWGRRLLVFSVCRLGSVREPAVVVVKTTKWTGSVIVLLQNFVRTWRKHLSPHSSTRLWTIRC